MAGPESLAEREEAASEGVVEQKKADPETRTSRSAAVWELPLQHEQQMSAAAVARLQKKLCAQEAYVPL